MRGAVSPAMRATASMTPVAMPVRAPGTTTPTTARHRVMPRARAASRMEFGTRRSDSSAVRATTGTMMMARATPPANAE